MMIDFHVHVYPPEVIQDSELISRRESYFDALTHNRVHRWATVENLLSAMKKDEVESSVIFGFVFQDLGLCQLCNDYVIDAVKRYPDKLSGFCVVPPTSSGAESENIELCRRGADRSR